MGDGRHGRVHIAAGTCALVQSRVNRWHASSSAGARAAAAVGGMAEGRVGGAAAGRRVLVVGVGVAVAVGVGVSVGVGVCCQERVLRRSLVAKVDLHGSPRQDALSCFLGRSACHEGAMMNRGRANANKRPWI